MCYAVVLALFGDILGKNFVASAGLAVGVLFIRKLPFFSLRMFGEGV
jgi:hypothetical protein